MTLTSIYCHFRRLNLPTDHRAMSLVGCQATDLYLATYGHRPLKLNRRINSFYYKTKVNVYPPEFTPQIVELIQAYLRQLVIPAPSESQPLAAASIAAALPAPAVVEEQTKRIRQRIKVMTKHAEKVTSSGKMGLR